MDIAATLASTVIFLFADGGISPIGTGFIVGYPTHGDPQRYFPILVTAKHVIAGHSKVYARFSDKEGKQTVHAEIDLASLGREGDLWEHMDEGVDIAVIRIPHFHQTAYIPIPLDMIASKDILLKEAISAMDRVVFPGLLVNFMGLSKNYPVMRDGSIAVMPEEDIPMVYSKGKQFIRTKQRVILINGTAIPGASGSPVFLHPGPRLKGANLQLGGTNAYLLGVMHGFYPSMPREVEEIEVSRMKGFFKENSGIAIVFPAWRLLEIFEEPSFQKRIREIK